MVKYESLLLGGKVKKSKMESSSESEEEEEMMGGKACTKERKETALKVARKVKASHAKSECAYGRGTGGTGMTYEQRCANLAKGRATRMANLKKKKMGGGNYTQDYVDESQLNYMGSPLDMYYKIPEKQVKEVKEQRGENLGGKMRKGKGMVDNELLRMGRMRGKGLEKEMDFVSKGTHTGMDMPTKEQFVKGGKMHIKGGEMSEEFPIDISGAIKNLALLAQKFGLKLVK
jgi:hypothetical protein